MSTRLTLGTVKLSLARVLKFPSNDPRVAEYASRAQERLLFKGKWVGCYGRYRICVQDSCLTWPREIETIETAALCGVPMTIRGEWFEFLGAGPGIMSESIGPALQLVDRGDACAFDDVVGTGKKLAFYCDGNEAAGARVLVQYYDLNGNKVYSTDAGVEYEGEWLTLPAAAGYVYSSREVMPAGWYGIQKPVTKRQVRAYEYTISGGALKPLAYFEPDETLPVYRRSLVPGISNSCCGEEAEECSSTTLDVVGKFRHRPVSKDEDSFLIGSAEALRLMCQAIWKEESNLWDEAAKYEARAEKILQEQLDHWRGSGIVQPVKTAPGDVWGGGGVENVI